MSTYVSQGTRPGRVTLLQPRLPLQEASPPWLICRCTVLGAGRGSITAHTDRLPPCWNASEGASLCNESLTLVKGRVEQRATWPFIVPCTGFPGSQACPAYGMGGKSEH